MTAQYSANVLVRLVCSEANRQAFRVQTPQMIAFAAVGIAYGACTQWRPTEKVAPETRKILSDLSRLLNIDPTAYQTFIVYVRRVVFKICTLEPDADFLYKLRNSENEEVALTTILGYMREKNIFTAGHIRIWAQKDDLMPLDLTRNTGDAAKFRRKLPSSTEEE